MIQYQEWMAIFDKTTKLDVVQAIYPMGSAPFEKVQVYPVPSGQLGLVIYSKKLITEFEDANVEITLPPGYKQALVENLAVKLTRKFGKALDPDLKRDADNSLASIKRQNTRVALMSSDAATISTTYRSTKNIYGGYG